MEDNHYHTNSPTRRERHPRFLTLIGVIILLVGFLLPLPLPVNAQEDIAWQELQTTYFHILYTPEEQAVADYYAGFVDTVYEDITTIFNHQTEPPITMRLYPSHESYKKVNPLAPNVPGIVAHADFRHREVAVIISATGRQTPEEVQNNVRHELTHIIAAELSGNRLNTGFQEGTAQYLEKEPPGLEHKMQMLQRGYDEGQLLAWSDLDYRDRVYGRPEMSYPQTLSIVSFLVERYGFSKYRDFVTISARSSGYRSALQRTYEQSPADLEAAWLAWLPSFLQGGYEQNVLESYDFSYARQLLELGRYAEANTELTQAVSWIHTRQEQGELAQPSEEVLHTAESLLAKSEQGMYAQQLANEARTALQQASYAQATILVDAAQIAYAELGDTRQNAVLAHYAVRAERGEQAQAELERAKHLSRALQFPQARRAADTAANDFALLGDTQGFETAISLRQKLDRNQHLAGMILVAFGVVGVGVSLWGRWSWQEQEVW